MSQQLPPQPLEPDATLKFTVQGSVLTSNLVPPTLTIDGYPAPTSTGGGSTLIPIMSGAHRLDVHSQWLRRYGQASMEVVVQPRTELEVFYSPPYHQFTTGALGLVPQQRRGLGCLIGLLLAIVVVPLLIIVLAVIFS